MHVTRRIKIQLVVFAVVAVASMYAVGFGYMRLPSLWFGIGNYTVTVELSEAANLYPTGNVTYRGTEVGRVSAVNLTDTGVAAELSLKSGISIPSDVDAQVHSQTAVGEQYVALLPRDATSRPLENGDVIPRSHTSVPPDINKLLDATNRGLKAIPNDSLKTVVDESYTAFGGLGPEFARFVKGSTALAIDAGQNVDALTTLIDGGKPLLETQVETSSAVQAWAAHLATITGELQTQDHAVLGLLTKVPPAADQVNALLDRLSPTLPTLLANMISVEQVAVVYRNDLEQLLVLLPQGVADIGAAGVPDTNLKTPYRGIFLSFHLNLNLPRPCLTGFLPTQQRRDASLTDSPDRPAGEVYCRIPQESMFNVRGVRNIPCETVPGKRAPTVKMCESDEQYVPLNDGDAWKGDPNATITGQDIPQFPPGTFPRAAPVTAPPPPVPAVAAAEYDPATGTYVGPDGNVYTQANLAVYAPKEHTWQAMLMPPNAR
jgi:phospholipid/cholesterol/gamma-HCH transport system substrate-binding protein